MNNKPFLTVRAGTVKVTVWENARHGSDRTFFSFDITRSYRDANDEWKETTSLTGNDALVAAVLLQRAFARVQFAENHQQDTRAAAAPAPTEEADEHGEIPY